LDDKSARVDVAIYSETFETYKDLLKGDDILIVEGSARMDGYSAYHASLQHSLKYVQYCHA
jgi:DNA polymerase-3 subunit alpha